MPPDWTLSLPGTTFTRSTGSPEEIGHKNRVLDEWCVKIGRDPKEIERSILFGAQAANALEQLDAYLEAGITHFIWGCQTPFDLDPAKRILEWSRSKAAAPAR